MTRDEIVAALRCCTAVYADMCNDCPCHHKNGCEDLAKTAAADLIENQQRHIEALMKANDSLKDAIARRDKQRTNYGFYTLSQCELCLAFKKGRIPKRAVTNVRQFLSEKLGRHSEKPAKIRERIDTMYGHLPRIELFARQQADGWDCWGNEVEVE